MAWSVWAGTYEVWRLAPTQVLLTSADDEARPRRVALGRGRRARVFDTVNVASRIEGKAPGGGVAIGPATKALLPEAVTESLGLIELKGKAEPLEVHRLLALHGE